MSNMAFQLEKMPYAYRPLDYDFMIQINTQKAVLFGEAGLNLTSDPQMDDDGIMTLPKSDFGLNKRILHFPAMLKLLKDFPACADKCLQFMPAYEEKLGKMQAYHFDDMSLKKCGEFLSYAYKLLGKLCYDRFKYALFPSVLGGHLTKAVKKLDSKYTNYDLYKGLNNKTALITNEVSELAESIRSHAEMRDDILSGMDFLHLRSKHPDQMSEIDAYLQRNGFKSDFNCYCVIAKTLNEDPDRLLNILRPLLGCEQKGSCKDPGSEYDEMLAGLSEIYGKKFPALKKDIECFRTFHVVREESQYLWESLFYYVRKALVRINMLLLENDDYVTGVSNLFYEELIAACERGSLSESDQEKIKRRNEKHALAQKVWDASKLLVFRDNGDALKGISGSSGVAVGNVCIVHSPAEFHKMKKGDILVCELTDPEWTPLFSLASAVVADTGSSLSHAAIVAREFQIPAVLGVGFATTKFKDGDMIRVDGDKGEVRSC